MENNIHIADIVIIVLYLVASFGFGFFANKILKSNVKQEDGFFLAGRKMPGWLTGVSLAVTSMNADCAPGYFGMAVVVGLPICWLYLSRFGFAMLLAGLLFAARWRQLGVKTGPEFYALRFGGRGGKVVRVWTSAYSVLFGMIPYIGTGLLGIHMIFGPIFDIESKTVTLSIILPLLLGYVCISGYAGVLITDLIQTVIILISGLFLVGTVLINYGGPAGLVEALQSVHAANQASEILSIVPVSGHRVFGPLVVMAWFILPTLGAGGGVGLEGQRIMSSANHKEAVKTMIWGVVMLFGMLLLMTLPALGALVEYPELYTATPTEREAAYGMILQNFLPVGVLGLALAALLASVMSTVDSHLNYGSQTLLNDVIRPLCGEVKNNTAVWLGRLLMVLILALAIIVVYTAKSLMGIAITLTGLFGSTALMGWAQWWWWRLNIWAWVAANTAGPIVYFSIGFFLKKFEWWQVRLDMGESMVHQLSMIKAVFAMLITTAIWVSVALLTKPESPEVLKKFYLKAHPMGAWGRVKKMLEPGVGQESPRLIPKGFWIAAVGLSWIVFAILAISELFVARYLVGLGFAALAVAIAVFFFRIFNKYMKLLELPNPLNGNPVERGSGVENE